MGLSKVLVAALAAVYTGKTTVTTAGTRVVLASAQAVTSVTVKATAANTGIIYVGNSTVAAANGFPLAASESVSLDITDLSTVWIDSSANSQSAAYIGIG